MESFMKIKEKLTSFQIIILGFMGVILAGSLLLMLPWASRSGRWSSFSDTLFTAPSAVCVTGLVVQDTATYWSEFGQVPFFPVKKYPLCREVPCRKQSQLRRWAGL